jgi:serine/threonine protein kinase/tetratricopeptide (TPR) repeat protein
MNAETDKLRELFLAALKVPADKRDAYLLAACAEDGDLWERAKLLIRAHEELGTIAPSPQSSPSPTVDQPPPGELPGTVIGPYKLLEQIGEGGMGTVWMAEQTEPIQRRVAVKVIKAGMDSNQVLARFEAERQALALMDHPHIAKVLDAGATNTGRPFFVMELVKGVPITRYCDEHRLTPRQRLELFVPVCQAIQHAHQKGIIHRDVKPSNVLVAPYDGKPVVKVIDFGVAKATGQRLTERTLFTEFGAVVGTLEYMSPEQAELNNQDIDTRSDIYSLGVLLYELLTGSTPLDRSRLKQVAFTEMLRMIREDEPPKPSTRLSESKETLPSISAQRQTEPAKLTKLVRGELDWIVMKALEKDRSRRYETANGFAMDVQRYLADETVLACPPSAWYRVRKFARRNKTALAVAGLIVFFIALLGAGSGWVIRDRVARRAKAAGQASESLTRARAWMSEGKVALARQELAEAKGRIGSDRAALQGLAEEIDALEAALAKFQRFLGLVEQAHEAETQLTVKATLSPETDGPIMSVPARGISRADNPVKAVPFRLQALSCYEVMEREDWRAGLERGLGQTIQVQQVQRSVYEELLQLVYDVLHRRQDHRTGQKLSPAEAARQGLAYLDKAETAWRPTLAFYRFHGFCRQALGEKEAARADEALARNTPPSIAFDLYVLGRAAQDTRDKAEGIRQFEAALRLEPTHYWSLMSLGLCLCDLGEQERDFAAAAAVFTGCILKRPEHAAAWYNRGVAHGHLRQYDKAIADYSRAIEVKGDNADAWYNRGLAHGHLRQYDRAIADYSRAIELKADFAEAWSERGSARQELRQYDKAIADYSRAIELNSKDAITWNNRGNAYRKLGQDDKAIADYSRAIQLDRKYVTAWFNRGFAHLNLAEYDKAIADLEMAVKVGPDHARALNDLAWLLATCPDAKLRDPKRAVEHGKKAVELAPKDGNRWNTLGVAHYRAGDWKGAVAALNKSTELRKGGDALDWLFLAMAHWKLGNHKEARKWHNQAVAWLDKNKTKLAKDKTQATELRRFQDEAEEVLELKKK